MFYLYYSPNILISSIICQSIIQIYNTQDGDSKIYFTNDYHGCKILHVFIYAFKPSKEAKCYEYQKFNIPISNLY